MGLFDDVLSKQDTAQPASSGLFDDVLKAPKRTIGGTMGDLGISALKGAIGVPESMVGIADLVTGGHAGKIAEDIGFRPKEAKDILGGMYSPAQQAANKAVADAKGFVPTVTTALQNPSFIVHNAIESAPSMLTGAGVARGALALAPKLGAIAAGAIGEGATAAGQNAEQVRQETPGGLLPDGAAPILAASGALTAGIGFGAGKLANKLGIGDAATMLAGGKVGPVGEQAIAEGAKKSFVRKVAEGAAVEGIGQELPQSYQEQVAQNLAQGKPWSEGAAEAGAQGMLAGGLMGAISGPLHSGSAAPTPEVKPDPLRLTNDPDPLIAFPDGTVGKRADVENYINGLPEDQRIAARAKLSGLGEQSAPAPGVDPAAEQAAAEAAIGDQIKAATPAAQSAPAEPPGGAQLHSELGVQSGMDQIAQEARAQEAAQASEAARIKSAPAGPLSAGVEAGRASGAIKAEAAPERAVGALSAITTGFGKVDELAGLAQEEKADVNNRRAALPEQQAAQKKIADDYLAAATADADARAASADQRKTETDRATIIHDVLQNDAIAPGSKYRKAVAELFKAGYKNAQLTEAERGTIKSYADAAEAFKTDRELPSAPNELDAQSAGIKAAEPAQQTARTPAAQRQQVDDMIAGGATIANKNGIKYLGNMKLSAVQREYIKTRKSTAKESAANVSEPAQVPEKAPATQAAKSTPTGKGVVDERLIPASKRAATVPAGETVSPKTDAKPASSGAQVARNNLKRSNPFLSFLASEGVSPLDRADIGMDKGGNRLIPGHGPIFKKTGKRLDELALRAVEDGHLSQADLDNPNDTGGTRKMADMINRAVAGREVILPASGQTVETQAAQRAESDLMQEAQNLGIETTGKSADQVYDEVISKHVEAIEDLDADIPFDLSDIRSIAADALTEEQINEIFSSSTKPRSSGLSKGAGSENAGGRGEGTGQAPGFELSGETAAEARARVAAQEQKQAGQQAAAKAADQKAKADDEVGGFALTGSDRAADVAASQGQSSIFDEPKTDRRQDATTRLRVADMTPDQRAEALLTSDLTGIPNKRAFAEHIADNPKDHVLYGDIDDFKAINSKYGHSDADKILRAIGDAKAEIAAKMGVKPFHRSGDEFLATHKDPATLEAYGKAVQDHLAKMVVEIIGADGKIIEHTGTGFSYGTGQNEKAAEGRSDEQKIERKRLGLRTGQRDADAVSGPAATGLEDQSGVLQGLDDEHVTDEAVARYFGDDVLFSKSGAKSGLQSAEVTNAIAQLVAKWKGFTNINVVQSVADLPVAISARVKPTANTEGFYDPKTHAVYLIADNLASPGRAIWVSIHEVQGHGGLRMLKDKPLNLALDMAGKNKFIGELAAAIQKDRGNLSQNIAVEEAIAELSAAIETGNMQDLTDRYGVEVPATAQNGVKGTVARVFAAIKRFIASLNGKPANDVPDAVVRALINAQREAVSSAQPGVNAGRGDVALASKSTNDDAPRLSTSDRSTYLGALNPAQEAAARNIGAIVQPKTLKQRFAEQKANFSKNFVQGVADQFAPLKALDAKAYLQARMSKASDGTLEALMMYGKPFLRDGVADVRIDEGFAKVLSNLDGEHDRFFMWVAAQRAERLKAEGKENLFTDSDISALKSLNRADAAHPGRAIKFAQALTKLNEFNDSVLQFAVESGILSEDARQMFKDQPYVPFYRAMDDGKVGPGMSAGLVNQYAFKKLKGGTNQLNQDLLANTLLNWSHLYSASAKNRAAQASLDAAVRAGVAIESTETAVRQMGESVGETVVSYLDEGKKRFFLVDDPHVYQAISALEQATPKWFKPFSTFKRAMTIGVTANPAFKIRNLIRDSVAAIAQGELSYNPATNIAQGFKATSKTSQTYASMLASGGVVRFGSMLDGDSAEHAHRLIAAGIDKATILDESGWKKLQRTVSDMAEAYNDIGDRLENVNRAALYEQMIAKGYSHAEASFASRDLLDFSMSGRWPVIRFLTQSVPFMNARIQGLYKLGRSAKADPKRAGYVVGAVTLASLGLLLAYGDDDDWKKREDFDRDNYWWFKIGDKAFRIPKPFEIGAIGTLAERTFEKATDKEMTWKRYGGRMADTIFQQFSMNPIPQLAKPFMDVYANKDSFTNRPIESMGMEKLRPEDRYTERTSSAARFLGSLGIPDPTQITMGRYAPLSPVQMDFLMRGYFGWLGTAATTVLDYGLRPMQGRGERADMKLKDVFLAGNFVESLPAGSSRYVTQMYDQAKAVEEAYNSYHAALKMGDTEKAANIMGSERENILKYHQTEAVKRAESKISLQIKRIEADKLMSGSAKRERLNDLEAQRDRLARHQ